MNKRIFTFWENKDGEKDEMPEYIKLCLESWKKYLPDYEIIMLNYSNLDEWIGKNCYDKILYEKFTPAQQSQAIRAAVLEQHGGIWFDLDIIVTNSNIEKFFNDNSELNIFENRIACIKAKKHSKILKKWKKQIKHKLFLYKYFFNFCFIHYPYIANKMMRFDYLSYSILKELFQTKNKKILNNISIDESKTYPEILWERSTRKTIFKNAPMDLYNHFYINNNFIDFAAENNDGIIILHNSWMPKEYKKMKSEELLKKNNTLTSILSKFIVQEKAKWSSEF